jgi:hypothetical protein
MRVDRPRNFVRYGRSDDDDPKTVFHGSLAARHGQCQIVSVVQSTLNFSGGTKMYKLKILAVLMLSAGFFSLSGLGSFAAPPSFQYCKADVHRLCKGTMPGGGKIMKCLKAHENDLTVGCAKELKALKAKMGK